MNSVGSSTFRPLRMLLAIGLILGLTTGVFADVDKINGLLKRAETNLQYVAENVANRTEPPKGAAGKLLANRLKQALDDLTPAKELLEGVPAGTEGLAEAAARYEAALEEYNRLYEFMTGTTAPPPQQEEGTPLNYQQEEVLKGARFNLREVEGGASQLTEAVERLRKVEDQLSIDFREVSGLLGVVENAKRKSGFVKDALAKLPSDGVGVAEVRQQMVNADAKIVTAADYLGPLNAKLQQLIDPARYPEFEADYKRLRDLSIMFNRPELFQTDRVLASETYQQAEAARAECIRIAQKYVRLMDQNTEQGKRIEGVGNGLLGNLTSFLAAAEAQKELLPDEIRKDLETAMGYAEEAVAAQKPLWFTGGIPQVMGFADERVTLLSALDQEAGKAMRAEYDAVSKQLEAQADSLRELIIRENKLPKDEYRGDDREEVIETALSAWEIQQAEFKELAVRIPADKWVRETKWTYSNGTWYFSDRSKLQVRLIVADHEDPKLAIDRPITIWKDHQKGDSMIGVPLWGFEDELQPSSYLLRSKIQKKP